MASFIMEITSITDLTTAATITEFATGLVDFCAVNKLMAMTKRGRSKTQIWNLAWRKAEEEKNSDSNLSRCLMRNTNAPLANTKVEPEHNLVNERALFSQLIEETKIAERADCSILIRVRIDVSVSHILVFHDFGRRVHASGRPRHIENHENCDS